MAQQQQWKLSVQIRVQEVHPGGGYSSNALEIREELDIGTGGFMEACQLLGQFHELAKTATLE